MCGSLERHRLMHLYLHARTDLFDGRAKKMLHIAPEPQLSRLFKSVPAIHYLSADIEDPLAMEKLDITDIQRPESSFDVIYCSHVLEHVSDDAAAMAELYRVLKPRGWAVLQVPITVPRTFEDSTITSPEERERVFGQWDHVRCYGPDYKDRLTKAGFLVEVDGFVRELDDDTIVRCGLLANEDVYLCRKEHV